MCKYNTINGDLDLGSTKTKRYSCTKCGAPFEIDPPDDLHTTASRNVKECEARGDVKMEYTCRNCGTVNIVYWCRRSKFPDWYA
jgi:DNA-directed RNA polymerase subunit RPC12/RpoP